MLFELPHLVFLFSASLRSQKILRCVRLPHTKQGKHIEIDIEFISLILYIWI